MNDYETVRRRLEHVDAIQALDALQARIDLHHRHYIVGDSCPVCGAALSASTGTTEPPGREELVGPYKNYCPRCEHTIHDGLHCLAAVRDTPPIFCSCSGSTEEKCPTCGRAFDDPGYFKDPSCPDTFHSGEPISPPEGEG